MVNFKCPICQKECQAHVREDGSASLNHPKTGCQVGAKDLLRAYVASVKPLSRFGELDGAKERFG